VKVLKTFVVNAALVAASILVTLLLFEGMLRLAGYSPHYIYWKFDPVLGWDHEPGHEGLFSTAHFRTHVKINSKGLRAKEFSYERPEGKRRILFLGDSYVWGFGVEIEEAVAERLEAQLTGVEVINGGVSGYSTDQELLWLEREGVRYKPDLVILVVTPNDFRGNTVLITDMGYFKPLFSIEENDDLRLSNVPLPEPPRWHSLARYLARKSCLVSELRHFMLRHTGLRIQQHLPAGDVPTPSNREAPNAHYENRVAARLVDRIRHVAADHAFRLVVVVSDVPSSSPYYEFVTRLRQDGVDVLEIDESTGFSPSRMVIPDDGHWNAVGHAFVADQLANFLKDKGFAP
jgi:lysophospholipase L1-like esterase